MSTGMRKWMEKDCPDIPSLPAEVSIDREELRQLRDELAQYKNERDDLKAKIEEMEQTAPSVPDFANTKDAARYRWLRENGLANEKRESRAVLPRGGKKASMAFRYWTTPEELDMTIDTMLAAAPEAKP